MLDRATIASESAARLRLRGKPRRGTWRTVLPQRTAVFVRTAFAAIAVAADVGAIVVVALLTDLLYHGTLFALPDYNDAMLDFGLAIAFLFIVPNFYRQDYAINRNFSVEGRLGSAFAIWNVAFVGALLLAFMTKSSAALSRGSMILFYCSGWAALVGTRLILARIVRSRAAAGNAVGARRAFLVGREATIEAFSQLYSPWNFGLQLVAAAVLRAEEGTLDEDLKLAAASARMLRPDDVFILEPWSGRDTIEACLDAFLRVPASIHLGPERLLGRFVDAHVSKIGPLATLEVVRRPLTSTEVAFKRLFDVAVTCAALLLLSPLFLMCAIAIKLDSPGPVLFKQRRYGFNQEPFRIYKFRTMTTLDDGPDIVQAARDDARITRVGRFLRRCNFDELPQLINVLKGEMSLVGPRPHALAHDQQFERRIALYARRHNVRPGITGWAQVNGFRGETETEDKMRWRVEHDLHYIDNWSLLFDLRILALTVLSPKAYRNAH